MSQVVSVKNSLRYCLETLVSECISHGIAYKDAVEQVEMEFIMQILAMNNFNISKSAQVLDINRNTLSKRIEKYRQFEKFRNHQELHSPRK